MRKTRTTTQLVENDHCVCLIIEEKSTVVEKTSVENGCDRLYWRESFPYSEAFVRRLTDSCRFKTSQGERV